MHTHTFPLATVVISVLVSLPFRTVSPSKAELFCQGQGAERELSEHLWTCRSHQSLLPKKFKTPQADEPGTNIIIPNLRVSQLRQRDMPKSHRLVPFAKSGQGSGSPSSSAFQGGDTVPPSDSAHELANPKCPLVGFVGVVSLCIFLFGGWSSESKWLEPTLPPSKVYSTFSKNFFFFFFHVERALSFFFF